jgi:Divergent InlB B-repeat domain
MMVSSFGGWIGRSAFLLALALGLTACGGGGDGEPSPEPVNLALAVSVSGSGTVTGAGGTINCGNSCSAMLATSTGVTLTASPAAGSRFAAWGGACSGQATTCTFSMDSAKSVTATFETTGGGDVTFALDVAVTGQGSVSSAPAGIECGSSCRASFNANSSVTLTAAPAAGQLLSAWGGACSGQAASCQVSMSAARSVTATFAAAPPAARAWQTAQLLETSNDFNVAGTSSFAESTVLTAMDAAGNALVIWEQSDGAPDGNTRKVYSRRYVAGQGWDAAVHLGGMSATTPQITGRLLLDRAGNAVWVRHNFETRRYTPAGGWTRNAITVPGGIFGSLADAKFDTEGTLHILRSGDGNVWHASLSATATQWSAWADVAANETAARVTGGARLAWSSNGSALAVWRERNSGDSNDSLWANRRPAGGAWQTPVRIEDVAANVTETPGLAIDANGNAIAAWHQGNSLYVNRFTSSAATWGTATEVDAGQVSTAFASRIDLVMNGDGRAVVGWNTSFAMKSMTYTPATGFAAPVAVAPYSIDRSMGIDSQGRVVIVYRSPSQYPNPTEATQNIYSRSMAAGGSWSDAVALEGAAGETKFGVAFAMNGAGQALCVWAQDDLAGITVRNSLWVSVLL